MSKKLSRPRLPAVTDVVTMLVMGLIVLVGTGAMEHWSWHGGDRHLDLLGFCWLIWGVLPLLWRTTAPLTVYLISSALVFSYYASPYPGGPSLLAPSFALVALAFLRGPKVAGLAALVVTVGVSASILIKGDDHGTLDPRLLGLAVWHLVWVLVGTMGRMNRAAKTAAAEQAEEAQRRRDEEQRLSIAREVHDVVAHSLAMINVQAGVGAHVADRRPEQAKDALLAIKAASHAALVDLRATLGVLRGGEDRAPTPGLARLPDLITNTSATGISVRAEGEPGELPTPADVAAFRIVQESLTNVVRHAVGADEVVIRFDRTPTDLVITVTDNGICPVGVFPAGGKPGGNGLRGMAERARALGGDATGGRTDAGGFAVHATLPVNGKPTRSDK